VRLDEPPALDARGWEAEQLEALAAIVAEAGELGAGRAAAESTCGKK
jgi:hypothetical protein